MKQIFSLAVFLFSLISIAQTSDQNLSSTDFNQETIFRLNVLSPSAEIEHDLTDKISILGNAGVGLSITTVDFGNETKTDFLFPLFLEASTRYYYNFDRRIEKGRNIQYNSGNYIGLNFTKGFEATGDVSRVEPQSILSAVYGLQRTYQDFLNFTFEAGPGYDFQENDNGFTIYVGVQIGFTL